MASLPFLIVHGALVWKALFAAGVGGGFALTRALRYRRDRRDIRDLLAATPGTLRGKLIGTAATHEAISKKFERSSELALDVGGERVELRGDVWVVRGAAIATRWLRRARLHVLRAGDEVIATGTVREEHTDQETGYRERGSRRVLVGEPTMIELVAATPAVRPFPLGVMSIVVLALGFGVVTYGVLHRIGSAALDRAEARYSFDEHTRHASEISTSVQLAAAMPGSREGALSELWDDVRYSMRGQERFELERAVAALERGCAGELEVLANFGHYEEQLELARTCADNGAAIDALIVLGRYDEALPLLPAKPSSHRDGERLAVVGVATGQWSIAARGAELEAVFWSSTGDRDMQTTHVGRARCIRDWLAARGGAGSFTPPPDLANQPTACTIVAALQAEPTQRKQLLEQAATGPDRHYEFEERYVARDLLWATTGAPVGERSLAVFHAAEMIAGWDRDADDAWIAPAEPSTDAVVAAAGAATDVIRGDFAHALARLPKIAPDDPEAIEWAHQLVPAIELRRPTETIAGAQYGMVAELAALRGGRMPETRDELVTLTLSPCPIDTVEALRAASERGDGGLLLGMIATCSLFSNVSMQYLLALAPRIKEHRAELATLLHYLDEPFGPHFPEVPFRFIAQAAFRRDLARLLGDEPEAVRWQNIVEAHLRVLADRDKVVAFRVLGMMH
jgi:hypothetical protein